MSFLLSTIIGVCVIELSFFIFHRVVEKHQIFSGFVATFILALIVMGFSFGNAVSEILRHIAAHGNTFTFLDMLLILFNMFYGAMRGYSRIAEINKKHGNL